MAVNMLTTKTWPCVQVGNFALKMQKILEDNSHKSGWQGLSAKQCIKLARSELNQVKSKDPSVLTKAERKAVIDCANYLMFALDNAEKPESEWDRPSTHPGKGDK